MRYPNLDPYLMYYILLSYNDRPHMCVTVTYIKHIYHLYMKIRHNIWVFGIISHKVDKHQVIKQ